MEKEHRDILRRNRVKLKRDLLAERISSELFSRGVIEEEDLHEVRARPTPEKQAETLLDMLPKQGPGAFSGFYQVLKQYSPHLANLIQPRNAGFQALKESYLQAVSLPCKVHNFVGRSKLCEEIVQLTTDMCRLILIVGPPGCGKSSTATMVGHMLEKEHSRVMHFPLRGAKSITAAAVVMLDAVGQIIGNNPVAQLQQFLHSLERGTVVILDNTEDLQESSNEEDFLKFLKNVGEYAKHLCTIVTTTKAVHDLPLFSFRAVSIPLKPLDDENSMSLMRLLVPGIPAALAKRLSKCCMGVPLLMRFIASLINKGDRATYDSLIQELEKNPEVVFQGNNSNFGNYFCHLRLFLNRLPRDLKEALARLAVFPTNFTSDKARFLFPEDTNAVNYYCYLSRLVDYSLLNLDETKSTYELHPQLQAFCRAKIDGVVSGSYDMAVRLFIQHYLCLLQELHTQFISPENNIAIDRYSQHKRNINHALKLAAEEKFLKHFGIKVSTEVVNFLAKVLNIQEFEAIYNDFAESAKSLQDRKMYSDCLMSLGFKLLCYHGKSSSRYEARDVLYKARQVQLMHGDVESEQSAHCLSKLGLCLVRDGDVEFGVRMITQAIVMRKRLRTAQNGPVQRMLVSGGYCDLAMALSTGGRHKAAATIWSTICLTTYREILGSHPFTATLLQYIGDAYHKMEQYSQAEKFKRQSVNMRKSLLTNHHPDSARSFFCLAQTLMAIGKHDEALEMLRNTLHIQTRVLASPGDIKNTKKEIKRIAEICQGPESLCSGMKACHIGNRLEHRCESDGAIDSGNYRTEEGRIPSL